ncbi:MAG: hypothetical protein FWC03_11340 [Treponema sp.]|nr:hypothetical protein [Treponema sp.]
MKKLFTILALLLAAAFVYGQGFDFSGFGDFGGMGGMGGAPAGGSNKARDKADDAMDKLAGNIPMRFFNALNRNPIPNAAIEIPNIGSFRTDQAGKVVLPPMADGAYTLTFTLNGFITTPINFWVNLGGVDFNWYNISPAIPNTDYRFVLEWGERPADLDIHFEKTGGSGAYHISYYNLKRAEDGNAVLDRDDTSGYGPETITVGRIDLNATYTLYVNDYTNRNNTSSDQMARSGATLRVYSQNRLIKTYNIPANGRGTRWNVFTINRGALNDVNAVVAR